MRRSRIYHCAECAIRPPQQRNGRPMVVPTVLREPRSCHPEERSDEGSEQCGKILRCAQDDNSGIVANTPRAVPVGAIRPPHPSRFAIHFLRPETWSLRVALLLQLPVSVAAHLASSATGSARIAALKGKAFVGANGS